MKTEQLEVVLTEKADLPNKWFKGEYKNGHYIFIHKGIVSFWKTNGKSWTKEATQSLGARSMTQMKRLQLYMGEDLSAENVLVQPIREALVPVDIIREHKGADVKSTIYETKSGQKLKRFNLYLDEAKFNELEAVVEQQQCKRSDLIAGLVNDMLEKVKLKRIEE